MKFSVVTTLYKSEQYLNEFHKRMTGVLEALTDSYEIIYVDDGSPDRSMRVIQEIKQFDSKTKLLKLSRNFGHHTAILAGLEFSKGEFVFLIDSDLEEQPESLLQLYDTLLSNHELEMVYGVQERRKGGVAERISGALYYKFLNFVSNSKIEPNQMTLRVMTRKFVNALNSYQDKHFTFLQLVARVGFKSLGIKLNKKSSSKSTYSIYDRFRLALKSFTLGSTWMLSAVFVIGLSIFGIGIVITSATVIQWAVSKNLPGWTSILCSIWILGGILMMSIGILAKYLESTLLESKNNPRFIVDWYL
jgi:putative glycosyltransferase